MYIPADDLRGKMNDAGQRSQPFLFAVDFEMERGLFVQDPLKQDKILFKMGDVQNFQTSSRMSEGNSLSVIGMIPYNKYLQKFNKIMEGLRKGNSYLANLTVRTEIETDISFKEIVTSSDFQFGICFGEEFVCFSPERFVKVDDGIISSYPMKGTIDATVPDAGKKILEDYKETCEHNTIVDLIRNDLGMVSQRVWVERFRYIDRVNSDRREILQVSSEIKGALAKRFDNRFGEIIFTLLPAGSVSGAPKPSTLRLILDAEGEKRGFYTGVFGYFDGKSLDSAVLIRYIERDENGRKYYRSGGGITINSICKDEYDEINEKIYLPKTRL